MSRPLKTALMQLLLSLLAAVTLGTCAVFLYLSGTCWNGGTDCTSYSLTRRWISFLVAPPVFIMQRWIFGTVDNVANFDPVVFDKFGWLALWAYYLGMTAGARHLFKRWRTKPK